MVSPSGLDPGMDPLITEDGEGSQTASGAKSVLPARRGGGIAVAVAAQQGARGLVLQNTFNRLDEVAAGQYPWLPVRWLIRSHYPSNEWIAGYTGPLLQSHGTTDEIVPYESGQALFDACPSADKQFFTIDGGYHNEAEPAEYDALLSEWFDRIYADKPEAAPAAGEERAPITP